MEWKKTNTQNEKSYHKMDFSFDWIGMAFVVEHGLDGASQKKKFEFSFHLFRISSLIASSI